MSEAIKIIAELSLEDAGFKEAIDAGISDLKRLEAQQDKFSQSAAGFSDEQLASVTRLRQGYQEAGKAIDNLQKTVGKPISVALDPASAMTNIRKLSDSIEGLRAKIIGLQGKLIEEKDIAKVSQYNKQIQLLQTEIVRAANAGRKGFDDMGRPMKEQEGILERLQRQARLYAKALNEATIPQNITKYNQKLEATNLQIKQLSSQGKTGFDAIGNAVASTATKTNVLNKSFSFLKTAANLIPGIGLAGLFGLIGTAAYELGVTIFQTKEKLDEFILSQKDLNEAIGSSEYTKAVTNVNELRINIDLAKQGLLDKTKVLKEYNDTIGKTTGQVKNLDDAELALGRNADAYVKMTLYKAAAQIAGAEAAKKLVEAEQIRIKQDKEFITTGTKLLYTTQTSAPGAIPTQLLEQSRKIGEAARLESARKDKAAAIKVAEDAAKVQEDIQKDFQRRAANIANGYGFDFFGGKENAKKDKVAPENVYRQKLLELKAKLAAINESVFTSDDTIRAKVAAEVKKGNEEYDRLLKEKKLTSPEAKSLKALNSIVGQAEISKELKAFNEKRKAAQKQIDDELEKLRAEDVEKRIANIKGEFEQESAVIQLEYQKQRKSLEKSRRDEIAKATNDNRLGLITDDQLLNATADLEDAYGKLFADLDAFTARKQIELAQKSFARSIENVSKVFEGTQVLNSEVTTKKINELTASYIKGELSYKKYQKSLTDTLRAETKERIRLELLEKKEQLSSVNYRLANPQAGDDKPFIDAQVSKQRGLRKAISDLERQSASNDATDKKAQDDADLARLNDYIQAYVDIITPILNIWQAANEAEAKSLDRSIAIQQRRVDAAQRIADRGNATYLKMEEDKMQDLRVKQEANAKRQISINAAIQASSALTAVISGVAKAVITGNPLDAIAAVGAIIAAIGAGYQLVNSLQQNQVSFYDGTEDTGPGGNVDNKKGFHAVLHPNERVMTAEQNKKLKGISNDQLVQVVEKSKVLVEQYRTPALPVVDYDRLEHAANFHITHDGRLAAMMEENANEIRQVNSNILKLNKTMKSMGVSMSMDRNGFLAIALDGFKQNQINKKI